MSRANRDHAKKKRIWSLQLQNVNENGQKGRSVVVLLE